MEAMRQSWTDDRLDDLARRMDNGFGRIDEDMRAMRVEIGALQRTMLQVGGGLIAAVLGMMVAVIGLVITQL
jgi:hypothetical protein